MNELALKMMEFAQQGFYCSQILFLLAFEREGKENTDVIRSMAGLAGGLGFSGKTCGTLAGGACLLGYYAGKGKATEIDDYRLNEMVQELVAWFEETVGAVYGSCECKDILQGDWTNRLKTCPQLVADTYNKVTEILLEQGYDILAD